MSSIRAGDYKLIIFWTKTDAFEKRQLFNLAQDPLEQKDLATQEPNRADALQRELLDYMKEVDGELPSMLLPRGAEAYKKYLEKQKLQL